MPVVASVMAIGLGFGAAACGSGTDSAASASTDNAPALTDQATPTIVAPDGAGDVVRAIVEAGVVLHPLPDNPNLGIAVAADPTAMYSTLDVAEDATEGDVGAAMMGTMDDGGYAVVLEFANAADAKMSAETLVSQIGADPDTAAIMLPSVYVADNTLAMTVSPPAGGNPADDTFAQLMERVTGE